MKTPPEHVVALTVDSLDDAQRVALIEAYRESLLAVRTTPPPARKRKKRNRATRYRERLANGKFAVTFFS